MKKNKQTGAPRSVQSQVTIDKAVVARAVAADVLGETKPATMEDKVRADVEKLQAVIVEQVKEMQNLQSLLTQAQFNVAATNSALNYARNLLGEPAPAPKPSEAPRVETPAPGAPVT